MRVLVQGLVNFLYNCPLDMLIESKLRKEMPALSAFQFMSMRMVALESLEANMNPKIVENYRRVGWIFAIYRGIELSAVYRMKAEQLEPLFSKWLLDWERRGGRDLNNPKIPVAFVADNGELIHGIRPQVGLRPPNPPVARSPDPFTPDDDN